MPSNGRWDLIRRLKVNNPTICIIECISWTIKYLVKVYVVTMLLQHLLAAIYKQSE